MIPDFHADSDEEWQQEIPNPVIEINSKPEPSFYKLREPKPLLSQNHLLEGKPKTLVNQIQITTEPFELLSTAFNNEHPHFNTLQRCIFEPYSDEPISTLWDYYTNNLQQLKCVYHRLLQEFLYETKDKSAKRLRYEMRKHSSEINFPSNLISLEFLVRSNTSSLRSLRDGNLQLENESNSIIFDSRFENANLYAVFEHSQRECPEFDLLLQNDTNTNGYNNWFYFRLSYSGAAKIKLNIVNLQKSRNLFQDGMQVAVFSTHKYLEKNQGWHRDGYKYCFQKRNLQRTTLLGENAPFYTLSFYMNLPFPKDTLYIAATIPYSYSRMLKHLSEIESISRLNPNIILKRSNIAESLSKNGCPILTITWKKQKNNTQELSIKKKVILIIARQHPMETTASFVAEGVINSLVHLSGPHCMYLLQNYIFKIVPMINVDGVIYGNSRCDISGSDANRKWNYEASRDLYPIICAVRSTANTFKTDGIEIEYFIDLHSHSRKFGTFMYCCKSEKVDEIETKMLAAIMAHIEPKFKFKECSFGLSYEKKSTARAVMASLVNRKRSITLETSLFGYELNGAKHPFTENDLHRIGDSLLLSLYAEITKDPQVVNYENIRAELKQSIDVEEPKQGSDSGSDSNPEQDEITTAEKLETFLPPEINAKKTLIVSTASPLKHRMESKPNLIIPPESSISKIVSKEFHKVHRKELPSALSLNTNSIFKSQSMKKIEKNTIYDRLHETKLKSSSILKKSPINRDQFLLRSKSNEILTLNRIQEKSEDKKEALPAISSFWKSFRREMDDIVALKSGFNKL